MSRVISDFASQIIFEILYRFILEMYRKLNIKKTLAGVFLRIREIRTQIDANIFSINYSKQSIDMKNEELKM